MGSTQSRTASAEHPPFLKKNLAECSGVEFSILYEPLCIFIHRKFFKKSVFMCFCPPEIQLLSRRTGAVLTRKMDTYKEGFLTKVASNHTKWWDYHSKWSSRLTCPPQIQLQSRRTGAILIRRIDTYKEVVLTKVASNHTNWWFYLSEWSSRFTCPPQIQPKSRRTGAVLTRRMGTYKKVVLTKVASNHTN